MRQADSDWLFFEPSLSQFNRSPLAPLGSASISYVAVGKIHGSQVIYQPIDYAVSSTELVFENPYSAAALSQTTAFSPYVFRQVAELLIDERLRVWPDTIWMRKV